MTEQANVLRHDHRRWERVRQQQCSWGVIVMSRLSVHIDAEQSPR